MAPHLMEINAFSVAWLSYIVHGVCIVSKCILNTRCSGDFYSACPFMLGSVCNLSPALVSVSIPFLTPLTPALLRCPCYRLLLPKQVPWEFYLDCFLKKAWYWNSSIFNGPWKRRSSSSMTKTIGMAQHNSRSKQVYVKHHCTPKSGIAQSQHTSTRRTQASLSLMCPCFSTSWWLYCLYSTTGSIWVYELC